MGFPILYSASTDLIMSYHLPERTTKLTVLEIIKFQGGLDAKCVIVH